MNDKTTITCIGCGVSTWYSSHDPLSTVYLVDAYRTLEDKCTCAEA